MDATDANSGIVRLNVGGKVFATTTQTLCKEPASFLARFCEIDGMQPSVKDTSGAFFIDRDPRYFRIILNYLRSDSIDLEDSVSLETLLAEADFYCLSGLTKRLEELRSADTAKVETPRVKTVSVTFYKTKKSKKWQTKFTSSDRDLRAQIESTGKVRSAGYASWAVGYRSACHTDGDTLTVSGEAFSLAELCDILGQCGLVLRHIEKDGETIEDEVLHFSSI